MSEREPDPQEILERLARLEARVDWLAERVGGAAPAPRRLPPSRPAPPRAPAGPIVWVAAGGSAIFLAGAAFFLHWSIQRGWIGPELRFLMGLLAGGGLAFGAARLMLGDSPRFGSVLLLAGLGTLIFSFRWGAFEYHFFPPLLGLLATFACTLLAGALGARVRSGAALALALLAGLVAPLAFSEGGHHEVALALYLAVLMASALAVPYLAKAGARWGAARWIAAGGTWLLLVSCAVEAQRADGAALLALLGLHYALAALWIWLPGLGEARPASPALLWMAVSLAATPLAWALWRRLGWTSEAFAGPVLLVAALNLLLVRPLRARLGGRRADPALLALAAGHLALAVPVALAWRWVGPVWGLFALLLAWAAGRQAGEGGGEAKAFAWAALGMASAATLRWVVHGLDVWGFGRPPMAPFLNTRFAEGALAALAWGLLARRPGPARIPGLAGLELAGVLALSLEAAHLALWLGGAHRSAGVALTLAWALAGALQWLGSLAEARRWLRAALAAGGYSWLGLASLKLLTADLEHADTPMKALAFLGVGTVILAAALVGNRVRRARREPE